MKIDKFYGTYAWFDLKDSTLFINNSSPEKLSKLLQSYFKIVKTTSEKFDGHVVDQLGDGIGVIFKEPDSRSSAHKMVENLPEEINNLDLGWRVGLAYGLITCIHNQPYSLLKDIYSCQTVVRAYRLGQSNLVKNSIRIDKGVYTGLSKNEQAVYKSYEPMQKQSKLQCNLFYC